MIHYHGTPITPKRVFYALQGRNFCVSYANPQQLAECHRVGQSVMLDNGAYSIWRAGNGKVDSELYWQWIEPWLDFSTTWAVIPDVIDGEENDNDRLIGHWFWLTKGFRQVSPVWHVHESLNRLDQLVHGFDKVCIGSSGEFQVVGSKKWHRKMSEAFNIICRGSGRPRAWIHMLRGLSMAGSEYPFASADSTNIARNHYRQRSVMRNKVEWATQTVHRIDRVQCPAIWEMKVLPEWLWE